MAVLRTHTSRCEHVIVVIWEGALQCVQSAWHCNGDRILDDVICGTCNTHEVVRNARQNFSRKHERSLLGLPRRWKQQARSKRRNVSTQRRVISQKTSVFIINAMKTSDHPWRRRGRIILKCVLSLSDELIRSLDSRPWSIALMVRAKFVCTGSTVAPPLPLLLPVTTARI